MSRLKNASFDHYNLTVDLDSLFWNTLGMMAGEICWFQFRSISLASVCLHVCICFRVYAHMSVGVLVQYAVLEKCGGVCGGLRDTVFMERPLNKQGLVGLSVHPA